LPKWSKEGEFYTSKIQPSILGSLHVFKNINGPIKMAHLPQKNNNKRKKFLGITTPNLIN
jgi:hypothetical protein